MSLLNTIFFVLSKKNEFLQNKEISLCNWMHSSSKKVQLNWAYAQPSSKISKILMQWFSVPLK